MTADGITGMTIEDGGRGTVEGTRDWAGVRAATDLVAMVEAIAPVHIKQTTRAPQPDDCLYRYDVEQLVVRELSRLRAIEAAARAFMAVYDRADTGWFDYCEAAAVPLRSALSPTSPEKPEEAK